jgi:hypothetical protein
MYRLNIVNPNTTTTTTTVQQSAEARALAAVIKNQLDMVNPPSGGIGNIQRAASELLVTTVKVEPLQDIASTSTPTPNGHVIYAGKRPRIEGNEDWLSSPSPGSVPGAGLPLSPSPGSQSYTHATTMSNGYSSPMSTGSYDPYSPNGKLGTI